jgi:hypothetical protein
VLLVVVTVRVEVADPPGERVRLDTLRVTAGPEGLIVTVRVTVPVKFLTLVTVIVEVLEKPVLMLRLLGLELTSKSGVRLVEKVAG